MENNKLFTAYALTLIAAVGSITMAAAALGQITLPTPPVFIEHVALGLMMRASYKSFAGWDWREWTFTSGAPRKAVEARGYAAPTGTAAGAEA